MDRSLEFVFTFVLLLCFGIAIIGIYDCTSAPTTELVTIEEVCKDEFGFAIKTENKCIQIRGGTEACFLGLKIGTKITVPVSEKKIYSIRIEDIE